MAKTVSVRLVADVAGYVLGIDRAAAATKKLSDKIVKHSADINQLATTSAVLGTAIAAGVGAAIKTYADFDSQMSSVAATGDDARANIDALRKASIEMGAQTKFSATEAAQGVENLLKAGVSAKDTLGGGLKGALDLAAAGQMSVADASEVAATAMTQFKLQGKDVPHIADLLAAGAGKAQGEVGDLAYALKQGGLVAAQYGVSIEETTGTLSAFAAAGLLGSDAGTSMKTMLLSLASPSEEASKYMESLGINAYDASGNFVGMAGLADQLRGALGGLSQEQRNSALATIFGNDAIRAASILYDQGGEGIRKWTSDVNDAGYASEVAATKMDNLKGDLEQLSGSLETALIGFGEGADGPLRSFTQQLTEIVNGVGRLSADTKQGVLAFAAVSAGALLGMAGLAKLAVTVAETRTALTTLGITSDNIKTKLSNIDKGAVIAAAALIAVKAASEAMRAELDRNSLSADGYANALLDMSKGGDQLDASMAKWGDSFANLGLGINDTESAFRALREAQNPVAEGFQVIGSALGIGSTLGNLTGQFQQLDQALTQMKPEDSAAAFAKLAAEAGNAGFTMEQQLEIFSGYRDSLVSQATALGVTLTAQEQYDLMLGKIPPKLVAAQAAAQANGTANKDMAAATMSAADAAKEAEQAIRDQANAMLAASGSAIGLEAAIDDASKSVRENGRTLDINSEKGRANRSALNGIASSALALREAQQKAGASTKDMTASTQRARDEFIRVAEKMGMTRSQAKKLADQYGLVPKKVKTDVTTPGMDKARSNARGLDKDINNINGKKVTIGVGYTVTSNGKIISKKGNIGTLYATGGKVLGPGTDTSDDVPAWLSRDEFVVKAKSARKIGYHRLEHLNEHGEIPGFAAGGRITVEGRSAPQPHAYDYFASMANATIAATTKWYADAVAKAVVKGTKERLGSDNLTHYRGGTFTENFANRLRAVERALGTTLNITQGGFRPATSYSGTSHRGDAVDIARPFSANTWMTMRRFGIAAWDRTGKGNWISHIHGIPLPGAGKALGSAIWQAQDYLRGGDGLADGGLVTGPGGPRDDRLLRRLSNGEFVVNAHSTANYLPLLEQMNASRAVPSQAGSGQLIDMDSIRAAVREGAAQGIADQLRAMTPRDEAALVRRGNGFDRARGRG